MTKEIAMDVKVLGPGCPRCQQLYRETEQVIRELGLVATLEKVEALDEILKYRILMTPGLVVDGEVRSAGRLPSRAEISEWLAAAAQTRAG